MSDTKIEPATSALGLEGHHTGVTVTRESLSELTTTKDQEFRGLGTRQWENLNRQRWVMLCVVVSLFVLLNTAVVGLVCFGIRTDTMLLQAHFTEARMVNTTVFAALIAGTVAQTGAIAFTMARFLFPPE
ncbi:MAG TPA: hypothetical protein VIY90_14600 [Steroidobacteraceae bacterium]